MPLYLPVQGKRSPEAAARDAAYLASVAEADLGTDIAKVERRLAQVRDQLASLGRERQLAPDTVEDERVKQLQASLERKAAKIAAYERAGNDDMVTQLTHARDKVQRQLDQRLRELGPAPDGRLREELTKLRAEEDALDVRLFSLTEQHDELARRHDAKCAAEDAAARLAAQRREFEARAFEEFLAGEQPCE